MKVLIILLSLLITPSTLLISTDFKSEQLKNSRVKTAYKEKESTTKGLLNANNIQKVQVFIRAFKKEEIIELWAEDFNDTQFKKITQYNFCTSSGELGPKRSQGDFQIPEGFYYIDRFNPWSNFYLSLGINYPNSLDRIVGNKRNLGGDIFIHGDCVTIGCIPITDNKIKELYIFTVEAKNNGQNKIPVHIFPTRLTTENLEDLIVNHKTDHKLIDFWTNLKEGYDYFESKKVLPTVTVTTTGKYAYK